jgi:hypothetical protein
VGDTDGLRMVCGLGSQEGHESSEEAEQGVAVDEDVPFGISLFADQQPEG